MGRASIPASIRWGEHLSAVKCLEASDGASIHRCQPGNVRFLQASDGASSHRCQPTSNVRFLEASHDASIHRCQPGSVRRWGEHPSLPTWSRSIAWGEHPSGLYWSCPVSRASDGPGHVRFLEASDGASIYPMGRASIPASMRWGEHPSLPT